jgi:hypothetical protein
MKYPTSIWTWAILLSSRWRRSMSTGKPGSPVWWVPAMATYCPVRPGIGRMCNSVEGRT